MEVSRDGFDETYRIQSPCPNYSLACNFCSVSPIAHSFLVILLLTLSPSAALTPLASTAGLYLNCDLFTTSPSQTREFFKSARLYIVTTTAPPRPRLCCSATKTSPTKRLFAQPRSCHTSSAHCAKPVAPNGWAFG